MEVVEHRPEYPIRSKTDKLADVVESVADFAVGAGVALGLLLFLVVSVVSLAQ